MWIRSSLDWIHSQTFGSASISVLKRCKGWSRYSGPHRKDWVARQTSCCSKQRSVVLRPTHHNPQDYNPRWLEQGSSLSFDWHSHDLAGPVESRTAGTSRVQRRKVASMSWPPYWSDFLTAENSRAEGIAIVLRCRVVAAVRCRLEVLCYTVVLRRRVVLRRKIAGVRCRAAGMRKDTGQLPAAAIHCLGLLETLHKRANTIQTAEVRVDTRTLGKIALAALDKKNP